MWAGHTLLESERLLSGLIESAMDAIVAVDEAQRVVVFNPAAERMFGVPASEAVGQSIDRFIPERFREVHAEHVRTFARTGMTNRRMGALGTVSARRDNGEVFPVEASISKIDLQGGKLFTVILRDIAERMRAEQALREREEQLRLFIEHAPVALAMLDRDMRYLSVSRRWLTDFGIGERDLRGLSHYDIFPEVPERWKEVHQRGLAGEVICAEADRFERADGSAQWIRWEVRPWHDAAGGIGGILIFSEDITARILAQEALRQAEERLRLAVEGAGMATWDVDLKTAEAVWSETHFRLLGYEPAPNGQASAEMMRSLVHPDDLSGVMEAVEAAMQERSLYSSRHRILRADDKRVVWLRVFGRFLYDARGEAVRFMGVVFDDTAAHEAEAARREAMRQKEHAFSQLDALFAAAPIGLGFWDKDLRFVRLNKALADIDGLPPEAHIGKRVDEIVPDLRGVREMIASWERIIATGEPMLNVEVTGATAARPDQERCWIESWFPVVMRGEVVGLGATVMDITARKRAELELRRLMEELEQRVERRTASLVAANSELEAFSYTVSHDLRAPVRHIIGFISLLDRSAAAALDEPSRRYLRIVSDAAKRMGRMIDSLLAFSRIGRAAIEQKSVKLASLVEEARHELAPETTGRPIDWQIGPLPEVRGDPALLRLVVVNLLSNAIKYTRGRNPARIEVGCSKQDGELICFVRDNGAGFDMRYADKLFGIFQRLHRAEEFEGTGIGLASVRRIIERHGGKTWAEGVVDGGATFYFSLPAREGMV